MTERMEKKAIGFINTIANRCQSCLRRNAENCRNCISSWANEIMADYHQEQRNAITSEIDYSLTARMMMIIDAIEKSGRQLLASEIELSDYCTKQLKYWTLTRMLNDGILGRSRSRGDGSRYRYFIRNKKAFHVLNKQN